MIVFKRVEYIDFSEFNKTATWITTFRNPLDQFVSQWYFCRFGDGKSALAPRKLCKQAKIGLFDSLDQCIEKNHPDCINPYSNTEWQYLQDFCTGDEICQVKKSDGDEKMTQQLEYIKNKLLNNYYQFVLYEQFSLSMKLLYLSMPSIFQHIGKFVYEWENRYAKNSTFNFVAKRDVQNTIAQNPPDPPQPPLSPPDPP